MQDLSYKHQTWYTYGRTSACIDSKVKRSKVKVTGLRRMLPALVCVGFYGYPNGVLAVDGEVQRAVVDTYGSKPKVREVLSVPPAGGSRKYEMFTPSHPQAVNQFVRDYNYRAQQDGYKKDLQRYKNNLNRTYNYTYRTTEYKRRPIA